ncbi:MAG: hypothetical protein ACPL7J_06450, partial [Desulfomonilaceae bacterium]
ILLLGLPFSYFLARKKIPILSFRDCPVIAAYRVLTRSKACFWGSVVVSDEASFHLGGIGHP